MAAHHLTMVAVNEVRPNVGLLTYIVDRFTQSDAYGLARAAVYVHQGDRLLGPDQAEDVRVSDVPGGVQAVYRLGGVRVGFEAVPLLRGRGQSLWEGAALLSVRTTPSAPVTLRVGGRRVVGFSSPRHAWLQAEDPTSPEDTAVLNGDTALLRSGSRPVVVAVRVHADGKSRLRTEQDGRLVAAELPNGSGHVMLAFARDAVRATVLATEDPRKARDEVTRHYARLLQPRMRTPEPVLDAAFRSAIITLEYNWIEPLGWNECIHHWYSLWHMQHSPAAQWLGQADRAKTCILTHADRLMPNGAAPQLSVDGTTRRDFGGSNQFFAWQIRHYVRWSGDREAARRLAPVLDRVIAQTWEEYDRDGNGLLGWGQQIGNQEDYVSTPWDGTTPTIEEIQMLLARAELAEVLGQRERASECRRRAAALRERLRERLWLRDLGRFAYFADPHGMTRLDGQYHTFAYPAIYGLVDLLDAWTGVRHLRDRLTGPDGEVYCSNNFPWHAVGTWGMQAGAAQQPWAALALAAAGLRNEAYRPLLAAARWAMDENHRGAWPEVSVEPTPAYFSPPAGLYIQACIEGLFGLRLDRPRGVLNLQPAFPDSWPRAELTVPGFHAVYRRSGQRLVYEVHTDEPLRRRLEWALPVGRIARFLVNGRPHAWRLEPGVACIRLVAETPHCRTSVFTVEMDPTPYRVMAPRSLAEGDAMRIRVEGARITAVEDRSGMLETLALSSGSLDGRLRRGLLDPYRGYGPLGLWNVARRTVFLWLRDGRGARWAEPVTVTVLPRYEAVAALRPNGAGAVLEITVRNNATRSLRGRAIVRFGRLRKTFPVDVGARMQSRFPVPVAPSELAAFCWGDNEGALILPTGEALTLRADACPALSAHEALVGWYRSRMQPIPLPDEALQEDTQWARWRPWHAYGHWPWSRSQPPLGAIADQETVSATELPGAPFALAGRRLAPVSRATGRPEVTISLEGRQCRKLFLLVTPLLDNHDTFSVVGRVTVRFADETLLSRTLHFPGDLDWWCPPEVVGSFATYRAGRERHGMPPAPSVRTGDWPEARPPAFPQAELWSTSRALHTASAVHSIVEVDLGDAKEVESVSLETLGADPALGLVAVTAEVETGPEGPRGTPWEPARGLSGGRRLFTLTKPGDLEGWTLEGDAFSINAHPGLFHVPTLNSLARHGEQAVGRALSPPFEITAERLAFRLHGGRATGSGPEADLAVRLLDAETGEVLASLRPPGTHVPLMTCLDVRPLLARRVRLELVDRDRGTSFAWIGISDVRLEPPAPPVWP